MQNREMKGHEFCYVFVIYELEGPPLYGTHWQTMSYAFV